MNYETDTINSAKRRLEHSLTGPSFTYSFEVMRVANLRRLPEFGHGDIHDGWNPAEWGNALAGETGELCNVLKKMIRGMPNDPLPDDLWFMAKEEIADVALYLDLVAARLDINLGQAIRDKFNATSYKHGFVTKL